MRQFLLEGLHPVRQQKGSSVESVCMQPHTNIYHVSINPIYSDAVVYVLLNQ